MSLPDIPEADRVKPISYDPDRRKFVFYDDAVERAEQLVSPFELSREDLKQLIIERHRRGPDYTVRTSSGETYGRADVIEAIEKDAEFGTATVEAEAKYVAALVVQISEALARR